MSKKSGVKGKTVVQLARSVAAKVRQEARDARTPDEQRVMLQERVPGGARKENARLEKVAA